MEYGVIFLSGFLMAWSKLSYESRGLIRVHLVHKMIGFIKVCGLVKGPGAWLQIILSRQGSVCNLRKLLGYSGEVRGMFEIKFIGRGFIREYIKGGGVFLQKGKKGGRFL